MKLPLFFKPFIDITATIIALDEPTSKHIIQVLRMQVGEGLQLTDGAGHLFTVEITSDNRKKCEVKILEKVFHPAAVSKISIAISPVKNNSRFEWFLEKATEIGVGEIIPLLCERTEKQHFKYDRMNNILVSAMLQSQQVWLPVLHEPVKYKTFIEQSSVQQKFIAHCIDEKNKKPLTQQLTDSTISKLILIGPEGDFTEEEIDLALQNNFAPVSLGNTRLRTETAGMMAAAILCNL